MKKHLRALKRVLDRHCGTVIDETYWRFRSKKWAEAYISEESINHPHRVWMAQHILNHFPDFKSLLEVGCAAGENLHVLHQMRPEAALSGIEINANAVEVGNRHFKATGMPITIMQGKADGLKKIPPQSVDVVLTDAMLICIGPDKIEKVLGNFFRIARRGLVFMEWHSSTHGSVYDDHWLHNYRALLGKFTNESNICFQKLPPELWGGMWAESGYLIVVRLPQ
ncbi:MAG: methyltransferase domain-containing protein [Elusimicrobia bacterium]|nr:methyltransferase domain-containing protein [Elusimicrobiota bacterium]